MLGKDVGPKLTKWGGLLGAGLLWAALLYLSPWLRENQLIEAPTTYWGVAGLTFLSAIGSVILAFFVIFHLALHNRASASSMRNYKLRSRQF
jgi:hypothetical protein